MQHLAHFGSIERGTLYTFGKSVWNRVITGLHCEALLRSHDDLPADAEVCAACTAAIIARERDATAQWARVVYLGWERLAGQLSSEAVANMPQRAEWW